MKSRIIHEKVNLTRKGESYRKRWIFQVKVYHSLKGESYIIGWILLCKGESTEKGESVQQNVNHIWNDETHGIRWIL